MTREVYDKVYFTENYSREISEKRERMMRESANSRINGADMPNATTVVYMEDTLDGGVTVTTGDFVAFFNKRCGYDRVGDMRRTLAKAQQNCDLKRAKEQRIAQMKARSSQKSEQKQVRRQQSRSSFVRFSFVKAVFGLMMVLALAILVGTSLMLDQSKAELAALESEVAAMQNEQTAPVQVAQVSSRTVEYSFTGEDEVELFTTQEQQPFVMTELLSAFAELWKS